MKILTNKEMFEISGGVCSEGNNHSSENPALGIFIIMCGYIIAAGGGLAVGTFLNKPHIHSD